jgi:hypothetical protein
MTLVCSLVTVPLPKAPRYVALSYYWGKTANQVTIRLNNVDFRITVNLYDALLRLRAEGVHYVWADVLCINQEDLEERSLQVTRMGAIYQKSYQVAAWLGAEPSVELDTRLLGAATSYMVLDQYPELTTPAMFNELLSRPYWGRVWIIQEVAMASEIVFYFGRYRISWEHFVSRCGLPRDNSQKLSSLSEDNTRGIVALQQFRDDRISDQPISFQDAIYRSRYSLATDPRDKLFVLLGLCFNGKKFLPEPNYTNSSEETFTEFASTLIESRARLDYIYLKSASRTNSRNMPSWVPDWTDLDDVVVRRQFDFIIQRPSSDPRYNSSRLGDIVCNISGRELTVNGTLVDTVRILGNIHPEGIEEAEPPCSFTASETKATVDLGITSVGQIYNTITGVGLLLDRGENDKDTCYTQIDASCSNTQRAQYENLQLRECDSSLELRATIDAWLSRNRSIHIVGLGLEVWWKILALKGDQIGDVSRIAGHFYESIRCRMRLLLTEKGYLGWIHPQAQEGDMIARFSGCSQYVVLRASGERYRVVGDTILPSTEIGNQKIKGCKSEDLRLF